MNKFSVILIVTSIVFFLVDFYILSAWTKLVKRRNWSEYLYIVAWALSGIMLLINIFVKLQTKIEPGVDLTIFILYSLTSLWYIPKMVLLPFFLAKDLIKFVKFIIMKMKKQTENINSNNLPQSESRRKFVENVGLTMAGTPFAMAGFGIVSSTYNLQVHKVELILSKLPKEMDGLKIVQISDLHAGSFPTARAFVQLKDLINRIKPDLVLMTGDFVNFSITESPDMIKILSEINSNYGLYGCLGNHDHYMKPEHVPEFVKQMKNAGIQMLVNENTVINTGRGLFQLAGVDNTGLHQTFADFGKALNGLSSDLPVFLMCHDPENWDNILEKYPQVDVTFSGHTHGGQFGFKLFGKEFSPVHLINKYCAGFVLSKRPILVCQSWNWNDRPTSQNWYSPGNYILQIIGT